jgi:hypothetical protein
MGPNFAIMYFVLADTAVAGKKFGIILLSIMCLVVYEIKTPADSGIENRAIEFINQHLNHEKVI